MPKITVFLYGKNFYRKKKPISKYTTYFSTKFIIYHNLNWKRLNLTWLFLGSKLKNTNEVVTSFPIYENASTLWENYVKILCILHVIPVHLISLN